LSKGKQWPTSLHYWASALLGLAALPLLKHFHLPIQFDWLGLAKQYWVLLAERAIFAAVILCLIGFPTEIWMPTLQKMLRQKLRFVLVSLFFSALWWIFGWVHGLILTVDTVAILELCERIGIESFLQSTVNVVIPALYLFCGLLLVSAYNDIIVSCRFFATDDAKFNSIDQWLLGGLTVSRICHWALSAFPLSFFRFLEFVYFALFSQVGAGLILIAVSCGRKRGLQFVGTILTAYFLALGLFYLWPSQGPYYLCLNHFSEFPTVLKTYGSQRGSIAGALARWNHQPLSRISFDYYVAFPCMHVVQPLIVMWFLRARKKVVILLVVYNTVLLLAIVLLEWHYVIDILAGPIVAAVTVMASEGSALWRGSTANDIGADQWGECPVSSSPR
jgi:hypothetical protein